MGSSHFVEVTRKAGTVLLNPDGVARILRPVVDITGVVIVSSTSPQVYYGTENHSSLRSFPAYWISDKKEHTLRKNRHEQD